ncbi:MAG TPA: PAS domain S-box protein [Bacteroidales bacterium]|nr:MAG: Sporulation kinase E [Bacteroidetes bacterium ADurb.Bin041]HNV50185.1 PAS domain S-box protein [Bacteroidales bacterium]HPW43701.1 PAS domain S-box protein [Bacteroidales bacterium]
MFENKDNLNSSESESDGNSLAGHMSAFFNRNHENNFSLTNLPVPLLIVDESGTVLNCNQEALEFLNCSEDELNFSLFEMIPPDYQPYTTTLLDSAKTTGKPQMGEMILVLKDGKETRVKIFTNLYVRKKEDVLFTIVIADLSDVKQFYEEKLFEIELKYRELAESINEGIYMTEWSTITKVNTPLLKIFGYSESEVIGRRVWEFVVPEYREKIKKISLQKIKQMDNSPVEVQVLRKNGTRFWAEVRINIFKEEHKIFGVLSDITNRKAVEKALKESELKYRSVVDTMNEGVVMRDISGKVVTWNQAAERILDMTSEEMPFFNILAPHWKAVKEDGSAFDINEHPAVISLSTGKAVQNVIMGIHTKTGTFRWIRTNSAPVMNNNKSTIKAAVSSFSDITYLKTTENKLREINSIKDKLFSIIAHDLKSPYNAQMGFLELLMDADQHHTPEQRKQFIQMLYESTRQSFALLDNLLVWSRNQTGKTPFQPKEFDIVEMIDNAVKIFELSAAVKKIAIKTKIAQSNLIVRADYEMTNTVLHNLLSNAIKFTPSKGTISISCKPAKRNQLTVSVKDTGIGMSEEFVEKLFVSDDIHSTPGTENEKGTGLGLFICKEFVERNGGRIWVKSALGKGTTFFFTIGSAGKHEPGQCKCILNIEDVYNEIIKNPEVTARFNNDVAFAFYQSFKTFKNKDFQVFSNKLNKLIDQYQLESLSQFAKCFNQNYSTCEKNQLNICFRELEKLFDKLNIMPIINPR